MPLPLLLVLLLLTLLQGPLLWLVQQLRPCTQVAATKLKLAPATHSCRPCQGVLAAVACVLLVRCHVWVPQHICGRVKEQ